MTIVWTIVVTNVDIKTKRSDVSFSRLDDVSGDTETYSYTGVIIETPQQWSDLINQAWQAHLNAQIENAATANFIDGLEASAKANLEAREI